MTISQPKSFLSEVKSGETIPLGKLAYFRERLRNRIYDIVLTEFMTKQENKKLTQAELANRIGWSRAVLNRKLGAPGNWTIDTISDLLLGMGAEPKVSVSYLTDQPTQNYRGQDVFNRPALAWVETNQRRTPTSIQTSTAESYFEQRRPQERSPLTALGAS